MSAHGTDNPTVTKLAMAGVVILAVAFAYQFYGWTFLSDTYVVSKDGSKEQDSTQTLLYRVSSVIDADTITVGIDGVNERIRLLGINTPDCFTKVATERLADIVDGKDVHLEYDLSQEPRDTYNNILAYVYLQDGQMANRKMIADGYAYEYTYLKPHKYQQEFKSLQNIAQASTRGLWNDDACIAQR